MIGNQVVLAASVVLAAVCGGSIATAIAKARQSDRRRRSVRTTVAGTDSDSSLVMPETNGIAQRMLLMMQRESRDDVAREQATGQRFLARFDPDRTLLRRAGMEGAITPGGTRASRIKVTVSMAGLLGLAGAVFTTELALIGLAAGTIVGFMMPSRALKKEVLARSEAVERHLSQMIEVVMLGLRSGLSLERSLSLYPQYFDNVLARSVEKAVNEWETGLVPREEALRGLARQFDSTLLERVMEDAVRSLRFGTPLAEALQSAAIEARAVHKARVEERVAKAPVKMMLPVGTLILPAMLLLVLGPVLLELATGL